jgi:hypothetical protein
MKTIDLSGLFLFPEYEFSSSDLTKTIREVLDIDNISEDLKEELRNHPDDYCVWIVEGEDRIVVSPPQKFKFVNKL